MQSLSKYIFLITFWLMIGQAYCGEVSFTNHVKSLWSKQGLTGVEKVRDIYKSMLSENEHDIVGLVLNLEDALLYSRFDEIKKLKESINKSILIINSRKLSDRVEVLNKKIDAYLNSKDSFPPELVEKVRARLESGNIEGLPMMTEKFIRLCEEEGLVSMSDFENKEK